MQKYLFATERERQAEDLAADLRQRFEADGGRVSVGLDGRSFWVLGASEALLPDATVEVRTNLVEVCLLNEAHYGGLLSGWAQQSGAQPIPGSPQG